MRSAGPFRVAGIAAHDSLRPDESIRFQFDGKVLAGYGGDSLASALLANGVRTVSRSFKFHRPRGVYACGIEEPNALLQLHSRAKAIPSCRATVVELHEGLEAFSQSGWPSVALDFTRLLDFTAPLWAAGFYNKTFIWPSWHAYEWLIRRMAGLGRAPVEPDPDRYDSRNLHCDVLVVGAGEAGLRAALAASNAGARVVLVEQDPELGGSRAWNGSIVDGTDASAWVSAATRSLLDRADVRILRRTTAVGYYDRDVITLLETIPASEQRPGMPRERYWVVRAGRVVLATGAIEQPLIFCNNDRPGIVLAGAARKYLRRYSVAVGRRVLVATNNDSAYVTALDLKHAGVEVVALADTRHEIPSTLAAEMRHNSIPVLAGTIPVDTRGFGALASVSIGRLSRDCRRIESVQPYSCDALAVSGGWSPALHLYSQAGGKLIYNERSGALRAATRHSIVTPAGAAAVDDEAGQQVGVRISPAGSSQRQWVDLLHDVTVADLELAVRENYVSVEHVKRYTTVGMSVDQGKTSHAAAIEVVARLRGMKPSELGHTTLRPPFTPVTLGAIAGRTVGSRYAPSRLLPMHEWHVANGALLEDFGEWKRPVAYLQAGETRSQAMLREARVVRSAAGLLDASSLGKIEVHGPDAQDFLDRFYINNLATLKPWRARYGLMLRENGVLFDDGTVVMLGPERLVITSTSANATRVAAWMEEWHQCEWPHLRVAIIPVTDQWATITLAGQRAREILSQLDTDIDLSNAAFPHLDMREGRLSNLPARIYRVSFTGELSYEINVPTASAPALWETLLGVGRPFGLQPFGLDALTLMRVEKGYLHIGADTDGTTVPDDVGWGKAAANKARDFIGKRSLHLPENRRPDRLQFVGLKAEGNSDIVIGSHMRLPDSTAGTDGWVTSAGSAVLTGEPIALALLRGGREKIGVRVAVHDAGRVTHARVVNPLFFDPAGERMNA